MEYQGRTYTVKELSVMTGLSERAIKGRYERGWSVEKMLSTPKQKNQYN